MKISKAQFAAFEKEAASRWDAEAADRLLQLYPDYMRALGVVRDEVQSFCRVVRDYAVAYQVSTERDVFKLIVIAISLGAHFPHDPRFEQGIQNSLARVSIPQVRRLTLLADFVETWLGATWDGRGTGPNGFRLAEIVRHGQQSGASHDGIRHALNGLVLQSPAIATPERREAFMEACLHHADGYRLREPQKRLAYVGGALLHGIYWFDDPLMRSLRKTIESEVSADDLCDRMVVFYQGFV